MCLSLEDAHPFCKKLCREGSVAFVTFTTSSSLYDFLLHVSWQCLNLYAGRYPLFFIIPTAVGVGRSFEKEDDAEQTEILPQQPILPTAIIGWILCCLQ